MGRMGWWQGRRARVLAGQAGLSIWMRNLATIVLPGVVYTLPARSDPICVQPQLAERAGGGPTTEDGHGMFFG